MSDQQLDEKIANTEIKIGKLSFTPMKLMIAGGIVSSVLGVLYGAFEIYKDYQDMKTAIQTYVTPDLSEINKKIAVLEQNSEKTVEYTRDVNTNLKQDIRRLEGVVDSVERSAKQVQRETTQDVKEMNNEIRQLRKEVDDKIQKALDNPLAK
jgi:predicted RNase H-like nuclease (RuvC/YqgF family)